MPYAADRLPPSTPRTRTDPQGWGDVIHVLVALGGVASAAAAARWWAEEARDNLPLTPVFLVPIVWLGWWAARWWAISAVCTVAAAALFWATHAWAPTPLAAWTAPVLQLVTYLFVGGLVWSLRRGTERERALSRVDGLTGLLNARGFWEAVERESARSTRVPGRPPVSLAVADVDDFKSVNDQLGHHAGDEALRAVARALSGATRRGWDAIGRIGGDEFAVLMPETGSREAAEVGERLLTRVREASLGRLTVSVGLVTGPAAAKADDLMRLADKAAYEAKAAGKGCLRSSEA